MNDTIPLLQNCALFQNISPTDIPSLFSCLQPVQKSYKKNTYIFTASESPAMIGIVLSGSVSVIQEDFWGNRTILSKIFPGDLFGESFACAGHPVLPVSVFATEPAEILFIRYQKIITTCPATCTFHSSLIRNMITILAEKNIALTQKMSHLTKRSLREKLLSYLSEQARLQGCASFTIPFNRQELADYLSVDRSALSAALGRMREEGILEFQRNQFQLIYEPDRSQ